LKSGVSSVGFVGRPSVGIWLFGGCALSVPRCADAPDAATAARTNASRNGDVMAAFMVRPECRVVNALAPRAVGRRAGEDHASRPSRVAMARRSESLKRQPQAADRVDRPFAKAIVG
jgi:hypothetical protein